MASVLSTCTGKVGEMEGGRKREKERGREREREEERDREREREREEERERRGEERGERGELKKKLVLHVDLVSRRRQDPGVCSTE